MKRNELRNYLDSVGHPLASEVVSYYTLIAPLPWTTTTTEDCGMYVAYFEEHFRGNFDEVRPLRAVSRTIFFMLVWSILIAFFLVFQLPQRKLYRISLCSRLLFWDRNIRRKRLIDEAKAFHANRDVEIPIILAKRAANIKAKKAEAAKIKVAEREALREAKTIQAKEDRNQNEEN